MMSSEDQKIPEIPETEIIPKEEKPIEDPLSIKVDSEDDSEIKATKIVNSDTNNNDAPLQIESLEDKILPVAANYDNKAFEMEEVNIGASDKFPKNYFNRETRPGTMMSMSSMISKSSRASVNCTSGRVKCPDMRLNKFFSYKKEGAFEEATNDLKRCVLPKDGEIMGSWLLTEITRWDLHKERLVLLTEKAVIIASYDFINMKLNEYRRVDLEKLKNVTFGDLKYPQRSFMKPYKYGAIKLVWHAENEPIVEKINPLSTSFPEAIFTSHHILYNSKENETFIYNCDEFLASLEMTLSKLMVDNEPIGIELKDEPVLISSYASMFSVLYNQNWLGFQLDRNGINF